MDLVANVAGRLPVGGEFGKFTGDCAVYAVEIGAGATDPRRPTTLDELNRLTAEAIQNHEAGPAGQMDDAQAAWLCRAEGLDFQQIPYARTSLFYWLGQGCACVCGFQKGGLLPGMAAVGDGAVEGHAVCILAHDGSGFTLANGDSQNGRAGQLDTGVLTGEIEAAIPTTLTIIKPPALSVDVAAISAALAEIAAAVATISAAVQAIQSKIG